MSKKILPIFIAVFFTISYSSSIFSQCLVSNQAQLQACMNSTPANIQVQANFVITSTITITNNTIYNITTNGFNVTWTPGFTAFSGGNGNTAINITTPSGTTSYPNNNGGAPNVPSLLLQGAFDVSLLPVELSNWLVSLEDGSVQLKWETRSELNNDKFVVERSSNGKDFQRIGEVTGAGTSFALVTYDFIDKKPISGLNYYRLAQKDFDGSTAYSPIKIVSLDVKDNTINVFPTIFTDHVTVAFVAAPASTPTVALYSLQGKLVFEEQFDTDNFTHQFSLSGLAAGQYLLSVTDGVLTKRTMLIRQ